MNQYEVYHAFKRYRDRFGLNQLDTREGIGLTTQNGALFTMEYLITLLDNEGSEYTKDYEIARIKNAFADLEVFRNAIGGLSVRFPESPEGDSMDNVGALLAFSGLFSREGVFRWEFAKRMKLWGELAISDGVDSEDPAESVRNHKFYPLARIITAFQMIWRPWLWKSWYLNGFGPRYFFHNTKPKKFALWSWFGRSPGFLGAMDLAAGGWTTPLRWFALLVGQFAGCFADRGNTDARKLPYVYWYFLTKGTGRGQRWFWKLMYRLWVFILLKQYPDGMRDVYRIYYRDQNHPISRYSNRYFGEKP